MVSDGVTARLGSLTANQERFLPWRTIKNEDDKPQLAWELETIVRGFFDRELFLDYIRFFVLFETDGEKPLKIAGYHQFHAVREAVQATITAANPSGNKRQVLFGIPKVQVKVSRCVAMQVSYCNNLPCITQHC